MKAANEYLEAKNQEIISEDEKGEEPTSDEERWAILKYLAKKWRDDSRNKQLMEPLLIAEMSFSDLLHLLKNLAMSDFLDVGFAFFVSALKNYHLCSGGQSRMPQTPVLL